MVGLNSKEKTEILSNRVLLNFLPTTFKFDSFDTFKNNVETYIEIGCIYFREFIKVFEEKASSANISL